MQHLDSPLLRAGITLAALATAGLTAQDDMVRPVGPRQTTTQSARLTAGRLDIVYCNAPTSPRNVVPGLGGAFKPGGASTSAFIRPWFSDDESHFLIEAFANVAATLDDIYLLDNTLLLQEGTTAGWNAGELVGVLDDDVGLSNSGNVLITQNTSLATNDDIVARYNGTSWTELAREGGLVDPIVPSLAGALWDDNLDTPRLGGGFPLWHADLVDFVPAITAGDEFNLQPGGGLLREGFTQPLGQAGGATNLWENFTVGETYVSDSGATVVTLGDTDAAATDDQILAVNNVVVLQENQIIPGSGFTRPIDNANGISQAWLDNAGNWWARGNNDSTTTTEQDWVVRNGIVVAVSDDPLDPRSEVVPGSGEHWDDTGFPDCFFSMDGSLSGAYAIGGVTDHPDALRDGVLVHDNGAGVRTVIAREGDPVDVDEDGLFDDDRFFSTFGNDDLIVLETGEVMFTATLENAAGTATDQGVFKVRPTAGSCVFRNGNNINLAECSCITRPTIGQLFQVAMTPNANTSLTVIGAAPIPIAPAPLFGGELLIDPNTAELYFAAGDQAVPVPNNLLLVGLPYHIQGARVDSGNIVLLNAIDVVVGS